MSVIAICPACQTENPGSLLLCQKCQGSLIGVERREVADPEAVSSSAPPTLGTESVPAVQDVDEIGRAHV